jgi:hypothetical protein
MIRKLDEETQVRFLPPGLSWRARQRFASPGRRPSQPIGGTFGRRFGRLRSADRTPTMRPKSATGRYPKVLRAVRKSWFSYNFDVFDRDQGRCGQPVPLARERETRGRRETLPGTPRDVGQGVRARRGGRPDGGGGREAQRLEG